MATQDDTKTAVSLLTAHGKVDVAADLRQRFDCLYAQGQAYQQRMEALEDQRRSHVERRVTQYRRKFDDDPTRQADGAPDASEVSSDTQSPATDEMGLPQTDPLDERAVYWMGKRLYLGGNDTQIGRLFWLLAKAVGRSHELGEVQRAVDGMETHVGVQSGKDEIRKAQQRLRTVISKLRERMHEADLDDHFVIVKEGRNEWPSYSMVRRHG